LAALPVVPKVNKKVHNINTPTHFLILVSSKN
jgi:hypothetical protein